MKFEDIEVGQEYILRVRVTEKGKNFFYIASPSMRIGEDGENSIIFGDEEAVDFEPISEA